MSDVDASDRALAVAEPRREDQTADCASCGDDCWYLPGYPWCRPCGEHHRPPECAIDAEGRSLMSCGCAWSIVEAAGSGEEAHYAASCYIVRDRLNG